MTLGNASNTENYYLDFLAAQFQMKE